MFGESATGPSILNNGSLGIRIRDYWSAELSIFEIYCFCSSFTVINIGFLESDWLVRGFVTSLPTIAHVASTRKESRYSGCDFGKTSVLSRRDSGCKPRAAVAHSASSQLQNLRPAPQNRGCS